MSTAHRAPNAPPERRFFLEPGAWPSVRPADPAANPASGTPTWEPRLAPTEVHHALHVVRLRAGDLLLGLDGRGHAWPLTVRSAGRRELGLEQTGEPFVSPAPGTTEETPPHVEMLVSWPKGGRAEALVDALTQIGVSRITPLVCEYTPQSARELSDAKRQRLERIAREACKQSRRLWVPSLSDPIALAELDAPLGRPSAALVPGSRRTLLTWCSELSERSHVRIVTGPEAGFAPAELDGAPVAETHLTPHILRIETAATVAAGIVLTALTPPAALNR